MSTIRSSREIDRVFRTGRRSAGPLVTVLMAETPSGRDPSGRVAFIAGKRLGNAVKRNRAKRLLRAAFREADGPWAHRDVLLIARPALLDTTADDVATSVRTLLDRMSVRA